MSVATMEGETTLLELRRDAGETAVEGRADRIDGRDDHNGNASGDEAVLDRGRSRFVLQKRYDFRHLSLQYWCVVVRRYRLDFKGRQIQPRPFA